MSGEKNRGTVFAGTGNGAENGRGQTRIEIDKTKLRGRGVFGFSIVFGQKGRAKIYSLTIE